MTLKDMHNNAIVYCEGSFHTPNGKTAHGLARFSQRFRILSIIDSKFRGEDAGVILDGRANGIPLTATLEESLDLADQRGIKASDFIMGLAPDGGRLPSTAIPVIENALRSGMNVLSGLHDFLTDNPKLVSLANEYNCRLVDIRKPPPRHLLNFFSGKIEQVDSLKIAMLGTDSAVGKRTTAWMLTESFSKAGYKTEMIGTGQTSWLQGANYCIVLDSLVNDFIAGEIEDVIFEAWKNECPDVILLEGQGSLLNPAYPGGFELLAAGRPDFVILQHAPRRIFYDGFPGYRIHTLKHQIQAIEVISGVKVRAITLNHERMTEAEISTECKQILKETGVPAFDVLVNGADDLVDLLKPAFVR